MTFLEKWQEEHPDSWSGWPKGCPHQHGYEESLDYDCHNISCEKCWKREIPDESKYDKVAEFATVDTFIPNAAREAVGRPKITKQNIPENISAEDVDKVLNAIKNGLREELNDTPHILDSGSKTEFTTGAVRDSREGKGRCDLLPLDVVCQYYYDIGLDIAFSIFELIGYFEASGNPVHLLEVLKYFCEDRWDKDCNSMFLETSKQYAEGAEKYGENNWKNGMPVKIYIDSAVRHYLKFLRGDTDEPHDIAFCWNIMCAIWTCKHKPELNDYAKRDTSEVEEALG